MYIFKVMENILQLQLIYLEFNIQKQDYSPRKKGYRCGRTGQNLERKSSFWYPMSSLF